ncbi:DNA-processing protein DprA [Aneurinibacillus terranovensis]|uniref:DNA-processing protein DprA n=1 Tax=Aneurinibacillus terranovensis TaxID=278991 RepID=UPI000423EF2A|nr:DNA-processing protein DprA [Aneurinibacillus terranovensis]
MGENVMALLALALIPGVGRMTIRRAREGDRAIDFTCLSAHEIQAELTVTPAIAARIKNEFSLQKAQRHYESCQKNSIEILAYDDERYPDLLRDIPDPPEILYAAGNLYMLLNPAIAIVGTRTPTVYGKNIAYNFGKELSEKGCAVVSGLARGIDGEAHRGALAGVGKTIAVLGCGLDQFYPRENKALAMEIKEKGLMISEYPPGTQPKKGFFPERNRLISGLSLGTIVVEAASRSGSLITSDMAADQGRDVFAVPGSIHSPKSAGCHYLIQQGAKLVQTIYDVLEEYPHLMLIGKNRESPKVEFQLTMDEALLLQTIPYEPVSYEDVEKNSTIPSSHLPYLLLSLQVKKCITQTPGPTYMKIRE